MISRLRTIRMLRRLKHSTVRHDVGAWSRWGASGVCVCCQVIGLLDTITSAVTGTTVDACRRTGMNSCCGYGEMHSGAGYNRLCDTGAAGLFVVVLAGTSALRSLWRFIS